MTGNYLTYTAFASVCLLLLVLPFFPAFTEWLYPSDSAALPISASYSSDIDHFSKRLHADVAARLGTGKATGYEDFDLLIQPLGSVDLSKAGKRLISAGIDSADPLRCGPALYVQGNIQTGEGSTFSALYATGSIALGRGSEIHDWAHADRLLTLNNNSTALRRISAGTAIELGNETWFERLQAPTVRFGRSRVAATFSSPEGKAQASYAKLPHAVQKTPLLFIVRGDCVLPPGRLYRGSLIVTGSLAIGQGTVVLGDVKARKGISIARNAEVHGAVTCEERIHLYSGSRVFGPLVSEGDVLIGASAVVGQPEAQTTVSARNIIVEDGVVMHGAVWAHEIGMVKPS